MCQIPVIACILLFALLLQDALPSVAAVPFTGQNHDAISQTYTAFNLPHQLVKRGFWGSSDHSSFSDSDASTSSRSRSSTSSVGEEHTQETQFEDCSICLNPLSNNFNRSRNSQSLHVARLKCSHSFHATCLEEWFETAATCPLCRHTIKPLSRYTETETFFAQFYSNVQNHYINTMNEHLIYRPDKLDRLVPTELKSLPCYTEMRNASANAWKVLDESYENFYLPRIAQLKKKRKTIASSRFPSIKSWFDSNLILNIPNLMVSQIGYYSAWGWQFRAAQAAQFCLATNRTRGLWDEFKVEKVKRPPIVTRQTYREYLNRIRDAANRCIHW